MTGTEFEARIIEWAKEQRGLEALVLGGSRAHSTAADEFSDWDFHLITTRPETYYDPHWVSGIAPCWSAHGERTPRNVIKISAVFAGGIEADFVPLSAWQMKLVYFAMRYPDRANWMPSRLRRGIHETRGFMLGSGYRLLFGEGRWKRRFESLKYDWPQQPLAADEFVRLTSGFWTKVVWVYKKVARPEPRSAMHWLHLLMVHHVYPMLAEEARLGGRVARPEGRKAEQWLGARRLAQTSIVTSIDQRQLASTLLAMLDLFGEASGNVAKARGFAIADHAAVESWLRSELTKLAALALSPSPAGTRG